MVVPDEPLGLETLPEGVTQWLEADEAATPELPPVDLRDLHHYAAARAGVERRLADLRAIRDRTVAQADRWLEERQGPLRREAARLDLILAALLAQHRERNPRSKTLECGWGVRVSQRRRPARFVRAETGAAADAALLLWLKGCGATAFVRVKEEPAWGDLAANGLVAVDGGVLLRNTGELLPDSLGIRFDPGGDGEAKVEVALGEEDAGGR